MRRSPARHLVYAAAAAARLPPRDDYDPLAPFQFNFVYTSYVTVAEGATVRRRNLEQDPSAGGRRMEEKGRLGSRRRGGCIHHTCKYISRGLTVLLRSGDFSRNALKCFA